MALAFPLPLPRDVSLLPDGTLPSVTVEPMAHGTVHPVTHEVAQALAERLHQRPDGMTLAGDPWSVGAQVHAQKGLPVLLWRLAQAGQAGGSGHHDEAPLRLAFAPYRHTPDVGLTRVHVSVRVVNPTVSPSQLQHWAERLNALIDDELPQVAVVQPPAAAGDLLATPPVKARRLDRWMNDFLAMIVTPALEQQERQQDLAQNVLDRFLAVDPVDDDPPMDEQDLWELGASPRRSAPVRDPADLINKVIDDLGNNLNACTAGGEASVTTKGASPCPSSSASIEQLVQDMRTVSGYPHRESVFEGLTASPDEMVNAVDALMNNLGDATGSLALVPPAPPVGTLVGLNTETAWMTDLLATVGPLHPWSDGPVPNGGIDQVLMAVIKRSDPRQIQALAHRPPYHTFLLADHLVATLAMGGLDSTSAPCQDETLPRMAWVNAWAARCHDLPIRWKVALAQGLLPPAARDEQVIDALRHDHDLSPSRDEALENAADAAGAAADDPPVRTAHTVVPSSSTHEVLRIVGQALDHVQAYGVSSTEMTVALTPLAQAAETWGPVLTAQAVDLLRRGLAQRCPELLGPWQPVPTLTLDHKKSLIRTLRDIPRPQGERTEAIRTAMVTGLMEESARGRIEPLPLAPDRSPAINVAERRVVIAAMSAFRTLSERPDDGLEQVVRTIRKQWGEPDQAMGQTLEALACLCRTQCSETVAANVLRRLREAFAGLADGPMDVGGLLPAALNALHDATGIVPVPLPVQVLHDSAETLPKLVEIAIERQIMITVGRALDHLQAYGVAAGELKTALKPLVDACATWDVAMIAHALDLLHRGLAQRCPELINPMGELHIDHKKILIAAVRDLHRSQNKDMPKNVHQALIEGLLLPPARSFIIEPLPLPPDTAPVATADERRAVVAAMTAFRTLWQSGVQGPETVATTLLGLCADEPPTFLPRTLEALARLCRTYHSEKAGDRLEPLVRAFRAIAPSDEPGDDGSDAGMTQSNTMAMVERAFAPETGLVPLPLPVVAMFLAPSETVAASPTSKEDQDNDQDENSAARKPRTSTATHTLEVEQQRFKPCRGTISDGVFKVLADNTPLRTVGMDPWAWQDAMDRTFPWMSELTARLVRRLSIQVAHNLPLHLPTIGLLGDSGVGKTLYWTEAMALLGHPFLLQAMAGMNDSVTIKGTAAGWANTRPGLAATAMATLTCGNPVVLLDEIDKVAGNDRNGRAMDALLPLLEASTAALYRDDSLQLTVDASHISWVLTLNNEDTLSAPLRNRLEVVEVKGPDWTDPVHMEAALSMGEKLAWKSWPQRLATPETVLSSAQKDRLRATRWKSLRSLGQAIRLAIEENLYHASLDQAMARRAPDATDPTVWRPGPPA